MKPLIIFTLALSMIASADAKNKGGGKGGKGGGNNKAEQAQKAEEDQKREEKNKALNEFLLSKDKNRDGSVTLDEYLIGEVDVTAATEKFGTLDKNKSRRLEKTEIAASLGF